MDNFVVSARKYRPDSFETVVGQASITRTLKNAVTTGQLAHAYLFCGPRGVGKTTCARIFAKTINCTNPGPDSEACGACESCMSFQDNRSFNIHELDAASNNSVDDIKTLIDKIMIPPQVGKYSTYIIDEVHMLSQQAFNAFLKTLEEPPSYAIFILATTEKHKILPTILSRCQIFDFKRISIREMMNHLAAVAGKEGVEIDDTSLNIIAQKADGSMRDALSVFDQVVSFCGKKVDYHDVIENLNVLDYDYYFRMTEAFLTGNYREALTVFDDILENGFDSRNYLNGLGKHFRNILMSKDEETIKLMELSGEVAEQYRSYSKRCSVDFLFKALGIIGDTDINFKQAKDPRLHVEISLMKLSALIVSPPSDSVIEPVPEAKVIIENKEAEPESPKEETDVKPPPATPVEEKQEKEEKVVHSDVAIKTGPRIKDFMANGNSEKEAEAEKAGEETQENTVQELTELNKENLLRIWTEFAEMIKEDQPRLYNTLTTQRPVLEDGNLIKLDLNNPLQEKALNSIHSEILAFIGKRTGVVDLELLTTVPEASAEKKLYTQDEKFKHMQEQNPQLGIFRNTFKLDFD